MSTTTPSSSPNPTPVETRVLSAEERRIAFMTRLIQHNAEFLSTAENARAAAETLDYYTQNFNFSLNLTRRASGDAAEAALSEPKVQSTPASKRNEKRNGSNGSNGSHEPSVPADFKQAKASEKPVTEPVATISEAKAQSASADDVCVDLGDLQSETETPFMETPTTETNECAEMITECETETIKAEETLKGLEQELKIPSKAAQDSNLNSGDSKESSNALINIVGHNNTVIILIGDLFNTTEEASKALKPAREKVESQLQQAQENLEEAKEAHGEDSPEVKAAEAAVAESQKALEKVAALEERLKEVKSRATEVAAEQSVDPDEAKEAAKAGHINEYGEDAESEEYEVMITDDSELTLEDLTEDATEWSKEAGHSLLDLIEAIQSADQPSEDQLIELLTEVQFAADMAEEYAEGAKTSLTDLQGEELQSAQELVNEAKQAAEEADNHLLEAEAIVAEYLKAINAKPTNLEEDVTEEEDTKDHLPVLYKHLPALYKEPNVPAANDDLDMLPVDSLNQGLTPNHDAVIEKLFADQTQYARALELLKDADGKKIDKHTLEQLRVQYIGSVRNHVQSIINEVPLNDPNFENLARQNALNAYLDCADRLTLERITHKREKSTFGKALNWLSKKPLVKIPLTIAAVTTSGLIGGPLAAAAATLGFGALAFKNTARRINGWRLGKGWTTQKDEFDPKSDKAQVRLAAIYENLVRGERTRPPQTDELRTLIQGGTHDEIYSALRLSSKSSTNQLEDRKNNNAVRNLLHKRIQARLAEECSKIGAQISLEGKELSPEDKKALYALAIFNATEAEINQTFASMENQRRKRWVRNLQEFAGATAIAGATSYFVKEAIEGVSAWFSSPAESVHAAASKTPDSSIFEPRANPELIGDTPNVDTPSFEPRANPELIVDTLVSDSSSLEPRANPELIVDSAVTPTDYFTGNFSGAADLNSAQSAVSVNNLSDLSQANPDFNITDGTWGTVNSNGDLNVRSGAEQGWSKIGEMGEGQPFRFTGNNIVTNVDAPGGGLNPVPVRMYEVYLPQGGTGWVAGAYTNVAQ